MTGCPLPLSIGDIEQYLSARVSSVSRKEFEAVIFALDDHFREGWMKEQERKDKK